MIVVERLDPADEGAFRALADMVAPMAGEVAVVPVDTVAAASEMWLTIGQGNTFVAKQVDEDGSERFAGILALYRTPYWYNPEHFFLTDRMLYVAPEFRFALIGVKLMRQARLEATPKDEAIFVHIQNPRRDHGNDVQAGYHATIAGYVPAGHVTVLRKPVASKATAA